MSDIFIYSFPWDAYWGMTNLHMLKLLKYLELLICKKFGELGNWSYIRSKSKHTDYDKFRSYYQFYVFCE